MNLFELYLKLGISHITDLAGFDHILFIIALSASYSLFQYKKVLVLITAFTLGHSVSLVLATLSIVHFKPEIIELLIPVTILFTGTVNIILAEKKSAQSIIAYIIAMCFGLIHGLGFSNYLKSMLMEEQNLIKPLFAFNIGIEVGQLLIVSIIFIINFLICGKNKKRLVIWNYLFSIIAIVVSLFLIINRFPTRL